MNDNDRMQIFFVYDIYYHWFDPVNLLPVR